MATNATLLTSNYRSSFCEEYKNHEYLGRGKFGIVFGAIEKDSDCPVAIKCVKLKAGVDQDNVLKELKILSQLNHPHVLRYHNRWKEPCEYHPKRNQIINSNCDDSVSSLFTKDESQSSSNIDSIDHNNSTQFSSSSNDLIGNNIKSLSLQEESESSKATSTSTDSHGSVDSAFENEEGSTTSTSSSSSKKSRIYLFIATSRCKSQSLRHHLLPKNRLVNKMNRIDALHIFYQIVEGVKYLHDEKHLIHRDLKPENILFSLDDNTVKIADFGLTLMVNDMMELADGSSGNANQRIVGTRLYMPPIREQLTYKFDIYSMGIILFELLYPISSIDDRETVLEDLRKPQLIFPEDFCNEYGSEVLKSLIRRLISHVPDQRPTANNLIENITTDIEAHDLRKLKEMKLQKTSKLKKSAVAVDIEQILTSPIVKQIYLVTDQNQYGVFDTSDRYLLIADDQKLKLFNLNGEQVGTSSYVHKYRGAGYVQRIVWCKFLQKFFILCQRCLFVFTPDETEGFDRIKLIPHIKPIGNDKLRFISCTNNNKLFLNHSYNKIEQYAITTMFLYREWTKKILNYGDNDEIRRTTCSITDEYLAFNVRLDKRNWVIDFRLIDDNLTLLKRIQIPGLTIYHNLQLSDNEWLTVGEKNQFFVLDENYNAIQIDTNVTSESDIYTRFFGKYFIVSTVVPLENQNGAQSATNFSRLRGVINFYELKMT